MLKRWPLACLAAVVLAGCADEGPVGLDPLVPPGVVRSFEVILGADRFLVMDTSITGFTKPSGSGYGAVARAHGGVLDAHTLARFALPLRSVTYKDTAGVTRTDNAPIVIGAELILGIDTLQGRPSEPVSLALYRTGQPWSPTSATWTHAVDDDDETTPWAEPGGTRGERVSTAQLLPDTTKLGFAVDSATLAAWSDTLDASRGALIVSETPGTRLRFNSFQLVVQARPSARPDTVVVDTVGLAGLTFVYDPPPVRDGSIFVGGTPAWRSYVQLRPRLDTLTIQAPCPDGGECSYRLGEADINYAGLVFTPVAPPAGFAPDDTARIDLHRVLGGGAVPLSRAPMNSSFARLLVPPGSFASGDAAEVAITPTFRGFLNAMAGSGDDDPPITLALIDATGGMKFGIASFAPIGAGADAPRLKLIISVVNQDQVR